METNNCEAFFGGLLPESETLKKIIVKFSISPDNSFALLKVLGHDCAGAITCHDMDEPRIIIFLEWNINQTLKRFKDTNFDDTPY
jgi:HipA N-terminal domain